MKPIALFLVFLIGRVICVMGRDLEWSLGLPVVMIWQDVAMVLVFALFDRIPRSSKLTWTIYGLLVGYLAMNVPLIRVLSTPLTPAVVNAAAGALKDSIWHHVTTETIVAVIIVIAAGIAVPGMLSRAEGTIRPAFLRGCLAVALGIVVWGPFVAVRIATHGLERNVIWAYAAGLRSRVGTENTEADWREPIIGTRSHPGLTSDRAMARRRNIVMVALESAGAQYLPLWGAREDPTPNLTSLAGAAWVFRNAYAVYPESIKGFYSVLCSQYPAFDTRAEEYENLPVPSLAAVLKENEYRTGLFHSGQFEYLGMEEILRGRGFEVMRDAGDIGSDSQSSFGIGESETVEEMLEWIDGLRRDEEFFLCYLPIAGHHPYVAGPGGPFQGSEDVDRYRNALFEGDAALGRLLAGLRERGRYDETCFIFYGDHGEAFGQHPGNYGHTLFLFEENVWVPVLIAVPGLIEEGRYVDDVISLIDLAPTICDLLGLRVPKDFRGTSLLHGKAQMALFYTDYSLGLLGLRDGPWKFIYELENGRSSLYDLSTERAELENRADEFAMLTERYRNRLRHWVAAERGRVRALRTFQECR